MAFSQMTDDLDIIARYPDEPYEEEGFTSAAFKASFDRGAKLCKAAHNALVLALNRGTAAANIGFQSSENVPANNVQAAIENVQGQITGVSQGAVPNGSITTEKLHDDAVTGAKIAAGTLLEDVTEDVTLTLHSQTTEGTATEDLSFYYCRALGMVYVRGTITITPDNVSLNAEQGTVAFTWDGYRPSLHLSPADLGLTAIGTPAENAVHVTTVQTAHSSPIGLALKWYGNVEPPSGGDAQISVYVSGWYFCDGPSEEE